ncbi:ABC transporter permease [Aurantimonas sp. DM33-3]|uniref:ABC transporter permease subunit n=1 Tax=Aurantimonas sp. DM33-3 TaxID=2766955 RepID=UPI0016520941|nr:ABC transporter permease [Aurantimonas sp. DM33-3]
MLTTLGFVFAQLLAGLADASSLFLVAAGLSLIFGVTRIVNFAHGSLFMLGAYVAYSAVTWLPTGHLGFWGGMLAAAVAVALIGGLIEIVILRRLYASAELYQLVATFGVLLVIQDVALAIWGPEDLLAPRAPGLGGALRIFGEPVPQYDLLLIAAGPVVLVAVWLVLNRTRWGTLVRAATEDREMTGALGVDQARLFTTVFMLGAFLAGLAGALQTPREAVSLALDLDVVVEAFVIVVVGGLGSIGGAYAAAVLIGVLNAFTLLWFPTLATVLPFLVMAAILVVRPYGLFGQAALVAPAPAERGATLRLPGRTVTILVVLAVAGLALLPLVESGFALILLTDFFVAALFAASLQFIMGLGGMISFGHAAFFGLGAYGAALAATALGLPMFAAMALGVATGGLGALVIGWFCVRLSGVYLAMLTLAGAQILWAVALQWQDVTGGDDGILGVWPDRFAASRTVYYLIALGLCAGGLWLIRRIAHAPFGYLLRATRDSPLRAEAIGLDVRGRQLAAFVIAGLFAALAGTVFVFAKGSVFPTILAVGQSVDALLMVLIGGVQALSGPIAGAAIFVGIEDWVGRLPYWRSIFGVIILAVCILAPQGIAGGLRSLAGRVRRRTPGASGAPA